MLVFMTCVSAKIIYQNPRKPNLANLPGTLTRIGAAVAVAAECVSSAILML